MDNKLVNNTLIEFWNEAINLSEEDKKYMLCKSDFWTVFLAESGMPSNFCGGFFLTK